MPGLMPFPVRLRLQPGLQAAPPEPFEGLHGLFADSLPDGEWNTTPAYDLNYNRGVRGHHSMAIQGKGKDFTRDDLLKLAHQASIPSAAALRIIEQACDAMYLWNCEAEHYAIPREQAAEIQRYIDRQRARLRR